MDKTKLKPCTYHQTAYSTNAKFSKCLKCNHPKGFVDPENPFGTLYDENYKELPHDQYIVDEESFEKNE